MMSRECPKQGMVRDPLLAQPHRMRSLRACAALLVALCVAGPVAAQLVSRLSITTGGVGGVYLPLGEGMASLLSKYLPGVQVSAAASQGSVENLKLIGAGKAEIGFTMVDAAWQAANGTEAFKSKPVDARTLMVLYPNRMQIVTREGTGIRSLADLRGKRVSTGSAGSGVEVMALRVLDAVGIDPGKGLQQQKLGVAESAAALKDHSIDAFFWVGGVPTAAITELARTPGIRIRLLNHADALDALNRKYGPLYVKGIIATGAYPGMDKPVDNIDVWNLLVTDSKMSDQLAYDIVKTLIEKKPELEALHKEAQNIDLRYQRIGSPLPYHPGARRYFEERGVRF
jgi:uncharacterized protein